MGNKDREDCCDIIGKMVTRIKALVLFYHRHRRLSTYLGMDVNIRCPLGCSSEDHSMVLENGG